MIKKNLLILFLFLQNYAFSQNLDIKLLRFINSPKTYSPDNFFKFISNSNNEVIIGIPVSLGVAGLIKKDPILIRKACIIVAANVVNVGITYALKYSVNRQRPFESYPDIMKKSDGGGPSFPSGHTSAAFATATSLSLEYPKWYVILPSYLWAGTVGYSRMYLGVHYPSDVLGGMVTGIGSAFLTYKINRWLNKNNSKKHEYQENRF